MLSEFAVLKLSESDGNFPTKLIIEWPSGVEDDAWVTCGELLLDVHDGTVTAATVRANDQFCDDIAEEYPGDADAIQLELETLIAVVAHYLPGLSSLELASEVRFIAFASATNKISAILHTQADAWEIFKDNN